MQKKQVGLWIDHRQALVVILSEEGERSQRLFSNVEKRMTNAGAPHAPNSPNRDYPNEDIRDRRFDNQINKYYDEVIALIRDANSIVIFGPGEAKIEFQKRLQGQGLEGRIVDVESADKMTDAQVAAEVRSRFAPQRTPKKAN